MLKFIHMTNWPKHKDRTFHFGEGFNLVWGANEAGKSLILEAFNFALFGSQALRVSAKDMPKGLGVECVFEVSGKPCKIKRTLNDATLLHGSEQVTGTTPVNAAVIQLLGFNRQMFEATSCAKQGDVGQLLAMDAPARRRLINNMVGLTPLEELEKKYSAEKSEISKQIRLIGQISVNERAETFGNLWQRQAEIPELNTEIDAISRKLAKHDSAEHQINRHKKDVPSVRLTEPSQPKPDLSQLASEFGSLRIDAQFYDREVLNIEKWQQVFNHHVENFGVYDFDLEHLKSCWQDYENHLRYTKLQKQGTVLCEHCGEQTHLAAESMATMSKGNPQKPALSVVDAESYLRAEQHIQESRRAIQPFDIEAIRKRMAEITQIREGLTKLREQWVNYEDNLQAWRDHEVFGNRLDFASLLTPDQKQQLQQSKLEKTTMIRDIERCVILRDAHLKHLEDVAKQQAQMQIKEQELEAVEQALSLVRESITQIKGLLLPRVTSLASNFVQNMSEGLHSSIEFDAKMDIQVDGKSISTLSGSGQAIVHIAVRVALAIVKSNDSLPIFIADEIDASMTATRAHLVVETLQEMLKGRIKQVLMISHKPVEGVDHLIEV